MSAPTNPPQHRGSISSSTNNTISAGRGSAYTTNSKGSGKGGTLSRLKSFSQGMGFLHFQTDADEANSISTNQKKNTKSKLELFVVCRFECLNTDDQKILRSASIIGFRFSRYVLYGILSKNLKSEMYSSLKSLEKHNWIRLSDKNESEYVFNHDILHDTIYDLTPSSDREQTHLAIAEYIEEVYTDDAAQFNTLRLHYSLCNPLKALEYSTRTSLYLLQETKTKIDFDLILTMDWDNQALTEAMCPPQHLKKVRRLAEFFRQYSDTVVPDPYYGGAAEFERVLDLVEDGVQGLVAHCRVAVGR